MKNQSLKSVVLFALIGALSLTGASADPSQAVSNSASAAVPNTSHIYTETELKQMTPEQLRALVMALQAPAQPGQRFAFGSHAPAPVRRQVLAHLGIFAASLFIQSRFHGAGAVAAGIAVPILGSAAFMPRHNFGPTAQQPQVIALTADQWNWYNVLCESNSLLDATYGGTGPWSQTDTTGSKWTHAEVGLGLGLFTIVTQCNHYKPPAEAINAMRSNSPATQSSTPGATVAPTATPAPSASPNVHV